MDREVASHLAFDLSLGARLSFARMVGTEPLVRPMRLLEWGLFIKGRGCRMVIKILLSFHSFRKLKHQHQRAPMPLLESNLRRSMSINPMFGVTMNTLLFPLLS